MGVRAAVIESGDEELARAFLDHENMRHLAETRRWWTEVDPAGVREEDRQAKEQLDRWLAERIELHGEIFKGEYGWAHEHLLSTSASYARRCKKNAARQEQQDERIQTRGPALFDLSRSIDAYPEKATREVYYPRASAAIHGSPRSLGNFDANGVLHVWSGPALDYLAMVIDQTSEDLAQLTYTYMAPMAELAAGGEVNVLAYCVARLALLCKTRASAAHHQ